MATLSAVPQEHNTVAVPTVDDVSRRNAVARARRIAKRHNMRVVSYRLSDGSYTYGLESRVPIMGAGDDPGLDLMELMRFCRDLVAKESR